MVAVFRNVQTGALSFPFWKDGSLQGCFSQLSGYLCGWNNAKNGLLRLVFTLIVLYIVSYEGYDGNETIWEQFLSNFFDSFVVGKCSVVTYLYRINLSCPTALLDTMQDGENT